MPSVEGDPTAYCRPSPRSWAQAASELNLTDPKIHSVDFHATTGPGGGAARSGQRLAFSLPQRERHQHLARGQVVDRRQRAVFGGAHERPVVVDDRAILDDRSHLFSILVAVTREPVDARRTHVP